MLVALDEYQTPKKYIKAAIEVMGSIDLDPACSYLNYQRLKIYVKNYYSEDGIERGWFGNVWLNPPYSKPNLTIWTQSVIDELRMNTLDQLMYLIPSYTSEGWYHKCLNSSSALCIPNHRIEFLMNGKPQTSPRFANTFFYFGNHSIKFIEVFSKFGKCLKID